MHRIIIFITLFLLFGWIAAIAQTGSDPEITRLSLTTVIDLAQERSIAARRAATLQTTSYWEYRRFKTNYKPQVVLNGTLPGFTHSFQEVRQPDGSVKFVSVSNNNVMLDISASQQIAKTGGTLFVGTSFQRFDDFANEQNPTLYNGAPIFIGFSQPLWSYNALKWDKKIEPLRYQESQQQYNSDQEEIALTTVDYFFAQVLAEIKLNIARLNEMNNDTLLQITEKRYELGKATRNDVLQTKMEVLKARKAVAAAEQDLASSSQRLRSFVGWQNNDAFALRLPSDLPTPEINLERALHEAMLNRPIATGFKRRQLEAARDVAKAKGETGFTASINASFGLSGSGERFRDIYGNSQDRESVFLTFSLPVMDWGRAKAKIETAQASQQLAYYEIEQDKLDLEQDVTTQITLFQMYARQVTLNREADEVAQARYEIAQERFLLGKMSMTDLSIALQEKDRAKQDYVLSLWNFWQTYYYLRFLSLYDFKTQQKIIH